MSLEGLLTQQPWANLPEADTGIQLSFPALWLDFGLRGHSYVQGLSGHREAPGCRE